MSEFLPDDWKEPANQRILIVDDDDGLREIFRLTLDSGGFDCACAPDGLVALALLHQFQPELIVLDLMMPRMNGHQFCGKLTELGIHIPIVIVSAFWAPANEGVLRQDPNVVGFLMKPIRYTKLIETIRGILSSNREFVRARRDI